MGNGAVLLKLIDVPAFKVEVWKSSLKAETLLVEYAEKRSYV
jgi:hypothetical protein